MDGEKKDMPKLLCQKETEYAQLIHTLGNQLLFWLKTTLRLQSLFNYKIHLNPTQKYQIKKYNPNLNLLPNLLPLILHPNLLTFLLHPDLLTSLLHPKLLTLLLHPNLLTILLHPNQL